MYEIKVTLLGFYLVGPVDTHKNVIKPYSAFIHNIFLLPDLVMKALGPFTFMAPPKKPHQIL